ncbi:hypothetical protein FHS78_000663 [Parvibaculum indicum]|uniref:hypothetical protein n=1 Tax=Parvibaculum indicum TaxID=562969 RepID=UPI00141FA3E9|nr:hypothetical protein [Parvibaculum indicum]NIJ40393.1 hypothetical protein [Parvibaculum indicum]
MTEHVRTFDVAYAAALEEGVAPSAMLDALDANIRVYVEMIGTAWYHRNGPAKAAARNILRAYARKLREARAWRNCLIGRMATI